MATPRARSTENSICSLLKNLARILFHSVLRSLCGFLQHQQQSMHLLLLAFSLSRHMKGGGKRGHNVADTNVSPFARARNICCGHKICVRDTKIFLISFRNTLCPQQMFPGLRSIETIMSNNVSATLCPRLPPPLGCLAGSTLFKRFNEHCIDSARERVLQFYISFPSEKQQRVISKFCVALS